MIKPLVKEKDRQEVQQLLAVRFRNERLRLGLSTADVAHYCGVSTSSVFGWEAGRSKIPMFAATYLWNLGFDTESVVGGKENLQSVRLLREGEDLAKSNTEYFVPEHIVLRHRYSYTSAFVYHNQAFFDGIVASGDLLLMGILGNEHVQELVDETVVLFRPNDTNLDEFLCKMRTAGRGRLHLEAGDITATVRMQTMLDKGNAIGEYCCRVGTRLVEKVSKKTHMQRFNAFLN